MKTEKIAINNHIFELHPCGAVYWQEADMLLLADVHLGKITHFRKAGFAVPPASIHGNFRKLDGVIEHFNPETVCFLGDLFHSDINREWELFSDWACNLGRKIVLVIGNHDILPETRYCDLRMDVVPEMEVVGFLLTHIPEQRKGFFNFCGHIHPCVRLQGVGRQYLKLPCFFTKKNQMILPAFGDFTGMYELVPTETDRIWAIAKDEIIEISVQRKRRA